MFRSYEPGREGYVTLVAELPAAAGSVRRPELLQARPERRLRNPRDERRRRRREPHVPVPVPDDERRQPVHRRRQEGVDPAGAKRLRRTSVRRTPARSTCTRSTRSTVYRGPRAGANLMAVTNLTPGRHDVRQAGRQHRREDDLGTTRRTRTSTSGTSTIPGCAGDGRVFVGQRKDPFRVNLGETFDLVNIKYPATELLPARGVRDGRFARRRQRDGAGPRGADRLPDGGQGRHHRRLDDGERARESLR